MLTFSNLRLTFVSSSSCGWSVRNNSNIGPREPVTSGWVQGVTYHGGIFPLLVITQECGHNILIFASIFNLSGEWRALVMDTISAENQATVYTKDCVVSLLFDVL